MGSRNISGAVKECMCPAVPSNDVHRREESPQATFPSLSARQAEIMELAVGGYDAREIGARLGLSEHTVRNHKKMIFFKLGVNSNLALMKEYIRLSGLEPSCGNLAGHETLSPRERQIVKALLEGSEPQSIAEKLQISTNTARNHLKSIYLKLGVSSYLELFAIAFGLR